MFQALARAAESKRRLCDYHFNQFDCPQNMTVSAGDSGMTMNVNNGTFSNPGTIISDGAMNLDSTGTLLIDASHGVMNPGNNSSVSIYAPTNFDAD